MARNWYFCQALPTHLVPCCWVGWWLWCAGCISQDTYLLYGSEPEEGLLDDERQSWPLRRFFLWFSIRPLIPPSILLKFSFSTEECLWSYWTIANVIFLPLMFEIHRNTVSTGGFFAKSMIEPTILRFLPIIWFVQCLVMSMWAPRKRKI